MTRSVLIDGTERAGITRVESIRITNSAGGNGEAGLGELVLDDVAGTLIDSGTRPDIKKTWSVTEDETASPTVLGFGRIGNYETQRHNPQSPSDRQVDWKLYLEGPSIELYGFDVHGQTRPVETDWQRFQWVCSTYLTGAVRASTNLDYTTLAPNTNTILMDSKTYNNSDVAEVIRDCAEVSHKLFFVNAKGQIFYDLKDSTAYTSTISISDRIADIDQETVFYAIWDQGPALTWEGQSYASRLRMAYANNGSVLRTDAVSEAAHDIWVDRVFDSEVQSADRAAAIADNELAFRAKGVRTYSLTLLMANDQVDLIEIGQRIQIKARAAVDADNAYVYRRIANLQWEVESPEYYLAHLQLDQPLTAHAVPARGRPSTSAPTGAPDCADTVPVTFALGVDGAGWTKRDDEDSPPNVSLPSYQAVNVAASGDHAILTNILYGNFDFGPDGFHDWYTGGWVTNDDYAPANPEEMLFRFTINTMGDGIGIAPPRLRFFTGTGSTGASVYMPDPTVPHDGMVQALGGSPVSFTLAANQPYYLRWRDGGVYLWEVGDTEPGTPTATGGGSTGPGSIGFALDPAYDNPSVVEVESLTVFQLIDDDFCLDDPGDSPYFAKSDDPRFDSIVTDHGALTGLADDDHTQYIKDAEFTAKGDLLAGTGSGTFDNLTVGSNGKVLKANSATSTGLEWVTETGGGSGPFEDVDTFVWRFISPAIAIAAIDESSYLQLTTDNAQLWAYAGNNIIIQDGKVYVSSDFGLVIPILSGDPAGGDSENGQVYYDSGTDKFRAYENGAWVDMIGGGGSLGAWTDYSPSWTTTGTAPSLVNGTLEGRYKALDANTYAVRINFLAGSSTTFGTGDWHFSLPATAVSGQGQQILVAHILDSGTDNKNAIAIIESGGTTVNQIIPEGGNVVTNTAPMTWANGDRLNISGVYEA